MVASDLAGSHLERGADLGIDVVQGGDHLSGVHADARWLGAVESDGQLPQGIVAPGHHLVDDAADNLRWAVPNQLGPGQQGRQVAKGTAQVETPEHPVTLPVTARGLP